MLTEQWLIPNFYNRKTLSEEIKKNAAGKVPIVFIHLSERFLSLFAGDVVLIPNNELEKKQV